MLGILFIIAMFLPTLLMAILKMWALFWVLLIFSIVFGGVEVFYKVKTGLTVSQTFWKYSKKHKVKAIVILASMAIMWVALLIHLGSKLFQ